MLRECVGHFTIARTVSERMRKYNAIDSEALYNPPKLAGRLHDGPYGDYVLTVTRLEHVKRVDLTIDVFERTSSSLRLLIAGDGSIRRELSDYIARRGLGDRVTLLGRVDDDQLIELYAGCRAVLFTPYQEDYGYVTLEAFLSRKPVITATDSGGPLEFVVNDVNGFVCDPTPDALAVAVDRLAADASRAAALGERGHSVAAGVTWDNVVDRLVGPCG
jgi:glycosyltransferase involved in cell wall biosynthesis